MPLRLAIVLLALTTSSALAQKAAPADVAAIKKCLKAAQEKGSFGGECVGLIADPCIKAVEGDITKAKACANRELVVWTGILDDSMKRITKGGFPDIIKAVTASQKTWAASRDQLCPVFDKIDSGRDPSTYAGGTAYCRLQETARRVLSLDKLGDAVLPH